MVGIMQSLTRQNKGLPLFQPARIVKARFKMFRIFTAASLSVVTISMIAVAIFSVSIFSSGSAGAIETTKASALILEEMRGGSSSLSFTKKSPPRPQADPCAVLLEASSTSPGVNPQGIFALSDTQRPAGNKTAAPVALGLFLGVRLALGPKEIVKNAKRVQIGPEFRASSNQGDNRALAIAAYRSCKNNHDLMQYKNNNKRQDF